jgi:uncharacterized lipoprotein YddW (UPF0748 family)
MKPVAWRKSQVPIPNTQYLVRLALHTLLAALVLVASCAPVDSPKPEPRVVFPTDNRPAPTSTPTPRPTPTATPRPTPAAPPITEYRALWVDGSNPGLQTPEQISQLIRDCRSISCNVLFVQVRIYANALYAKSSEPRLASFPNGFDPLTDVISKAHSVSPPIEVHAWMNAFSIWPTDSDPPPSPQHILNTHGLSATGTDMWLALNEQGNTSGSGLYWLDPGNPEAAAHVVRQVVNVVKNYEVDGVHLDYVRYGGVQWGYNPTSLARFRARYNRSDTSMPAPDDAQWSQWRRDQVTAVVRRIWLESTTLNPRIKVSAALIPWGNGPASDDVWLTTSAYRAVFQDWRAWLQEGILDMGVPMNYFPDSTMAANFDQWIEFEKNHRYNRHVILGMGNYLNSFDETIAQIRRARGRSASGARADGLAIYVYNQTTKDRLPFWQFTEATTLGATPSPAIPIFAPNAPMPAMPWKSEPSTGHVMGFVVSNDKPVDGVAVTLTGTVRRTLTTDGNGFYGFVDLPPAVYRVTVLTVTLPVTVTPGTVALLNFVR